MTLKREVALRYAEGTAGGSPLPTDDDGESGTKPALVFEMQMGMLNRGGRSLRPT